MTDTLSQYVPSWAAYAFSIVIGLLTLVYLHEAKQLSVRWWARNVVVALSVFGAVSGYLYAKHSQTEIHSLAERVDNAERIAADAQRGIKGFRIPVGAEDRLTAVARDLGMPSGTVGVSAIANRDNKAVCEMITRALQSAGWTVKGNCAVASLLGDEGNPTTPAIIASQPTETARARALADALTREGVKTGTVVYALSERGGEYSMSLAVIYL